MKAFKKGKIITFASPKFFAVKPKVKRLNKPEI